MMTPTELLANNALFDTMSPADVEQLGKRLVELHCKKEQLIFEKGASGSSMFIIRSGRVEIFLPAEGDSPKVVLKALHTGEYFGELSLFDDKPRSEHCPRITVAKLLAQSSNSGASACRLRPVLPTA